jgi:FkbM family methyltransferase
MAFVNKVKNRIKSSRLAKYYYFGLSAYLSMNPKIKFYSQCNEDELMLKYLPEKIGTYIDVGAGQPVRGSNTYYFYKKGWTGHLFEPIQSNINLLNFFRKRDLKYRKLIGEINSKSEFYEFVPTEYSTTIKSIAEELVMQGRKLRKVYSLESIRLSDTNIELGPLEASFISIDVEGADLQVLNSIDWSRIKPRVVCVEASSETNSVLIREKLEFEGYILVDDSGSSKIYLHESYSV